MLKCVHMEYFSCLLSPECCPPHFDKKVFTFRWPSSAAQDLTNIWTMKSFHTKRFCWGGFFFLLQTKQLLIWLQSKQNLSYYCIKLWGVFFFSCSFIQSDVPVIYVVCVVKKIKNKIYLYNLISRTVTDVFFFPFTLHSSSEESFLG